MTKFRVTAFCKKCGNKTFIIKKISEGESEDNVLIRETMCHDGFGWDLNTFDIVCSKCKSVNLDRFEVRA